MSPRRPFVHRLSLTLCGLLAAGWLAGYAVSTKARENATLNFEDADISAVIATVSEITGRNFIVDPRVKGKVTVLSPTPLSPDGVYQAFLSILQVHGFAAVTVGGITKIVPDTDAKQEGIDYSRGGRAGDDEIVTRVIQVDNVSATQLVPILRPLIPQYGHLAAYNSSNSLIISDRASNVARIESLVRRIDQTTDRDIEAVKLEYATAAEVVRLVSSLYQEAKKTDPTAAQANVVADERTNSILISGDKSQRLEVRALIAQLDTQTDQEGNTQVIYLRFAKAEELAPVLEGYAAQSTTKSSSSGSSGTLGVVNAAAATSPASTSSYSYAGNSDNPYRIIPEPGTNALVITAPPKAMRALRSVIEQLDIRRAQVLVEAVIAEVSESKSRQLGIDTALFKEGKIAAANILDKDTLSAIATAVAGGTPAGILKQGGTLVGAGERNGTSFGLIIHALAGDGKTNILSTPSIVTLDNEEAEISVGQEVPFLTGSFSNTSTNGAVNPFQTIERKDVGLTLKITPQINEGDNVQLKISQEVSSIAAGVTGATDLVTNKRTLNTSVIVGSGDVLVLGGLIDDNVVENKTQVPVLGSIPIIGELFKNRNVTKDKRNLMIFIRPSVLRSRDSADYYTRKKYDYVRDLEQESQRRGVPMMGKDQIPVAPPYDRLLMDQPPPSPSFPPTGAGKLVTPAPSQPEPAAAPH
jgi:general secretion pathway protein D